MGVSNKSHACYQHVNWAQHRTRAGLRSPEWPRVAAVQRLSRHRQAVRSTCSQQPLTTLRGAPVAVDSRRATRLVVTFCLAALGLAVVSLFVAGINKNAQVTLLRQHGVRVEVTVTGCRGLLGGSGSNAVGATCRGTFVLDGRSYSDTIPGDTLRGPGTTLRLVTAESDPGVVATVHQAETEHASWRILPSPVRAPGGTLGPRDLICYRAAKGLTVRQFSRLC